MKHRLTVLSSIIINLLLIGISFPIQAQISGYTPIFTSTEYISNARWSNDGTLFTFQEEPLIFSDQDVDTKAGFYTEDDTWYGYPVILGQPVRSDTQLLSSNQWLLASELKENINNLPQLASRDGQPSFAFVSPDGRFAVYAALQQAEYQYYSLAVANLETGKMVTTTAVQVFGLKDFSSNYHVIWSGDSAAFTIETTSAYAAAFVHYITGYAEDLNKITFTRLDDGIPKGDDPQIVQMQPWALSYDGKRVLLGIYASSGLAIWNTDKSPVDSLTLINPRIIGKDAASVVQAATFTTDEQSVLYLGTEGLVQYDLASRNAIVLDDKVKATTDIHGYFSPDATHLGIIENHHPINEPNYWAAYVIDVNTK
ncbi:MAG TPA: hypothetical protein VHL11_21790 [Phototrophicaceae bacterium]|jgi:hypothetical protein|nr:hypothetical protein [Phototrophicaceae bacterium]